MKNYKQITTYDEVKEQYKNVANDMNYQFTTLEEIPENDNLSFYERLCWHLFFATKYCEQYLIPLPDNEALIFGLLPFEEAKQRGCDVVNIYSITVDKSESGFGCNAIGYGEKVIEPKPKFKIKHIKKVSLFEENEFI